MPEYTLGIDIGTSSVKAGLLELSSGRLEYISQRSYDNAALQSTRVSWEKTLEVLQDVGAYISAGGKIAAIGLSGQMHGTVMYDKHGRVIEPLINWQDKRCDQPIAKYQGKSTIDVISERLQGADLRELGIDRMASGFLGATLFYIKENDPLLFNRIQFVNLPSDFIRAKLLDFSQPATDQTNACSTGLFNTLENLWHQEIIQLLELPFDILPQVFDTAEIAGYLADNVSTNTGLPVAMPIIYGGGDLQMSVLGSGLTAPDSPDLLNIGTGAQIARITGSFEKLSGLDTWPFFERNYVHIGASLGGGVNYHWLRDMLRSDRCAGISYQEMDELAERVPAGSFGLRFCTGPTRQDPRRKSCFYGDLTHNQDVGCMARAVMEGVFMDLFEYYQQMGASSHKVMIGAGNGLGKSPVWSQIAADMFDRKMFIVDTENAVHGAAILAASRMREFGDLKSAAGKITYSTFEPDRENAAVYREIIENYMDKQK